MNIVFENETDTSGLGELVQALTDCNFSEACCIAAIGSDSVYIRCPNSMHGVVMERANCNAKSIHWATTALGGSVALSS